MKKEKYNPQIRYSVKCRAIMMQDHNNVPGSEVEKIKTNWEKKFNGRADFQTYFMINEVRVK